MIGCFNRLNRPSRLIVWGRQLSNVSGSGMFYRAPGGPYCTGTYAGTRAGPVLWPLPTRNHFATPAFDSRLLSRVTKFDMRSKLLGAGTGRCWFWGRGKIIHILKLATMPSYARTVKITQLKTLDCFEDDCNGHTRYSVILFCYSAILLKY